MFVSGPSRSRRAVSGRDPVGLRTGRRRSADRSMAAAAHPGRRGRRRALRPRDHPPVTAEAADGPAPSAVGAGSPSAIPLLIEGLGVRYPGRREHSLAAIDLTFGRGERIGVAGRTGAGKSTLTLAAAGFIPRVVRAKLDGRVVIEGIETATAAPGVAPRPGRDRLRDPGAISCLPRNRPFVKSSRSASRTWASREARWTHGSMPRSPAWRSATSRTASRSHCPVGSNNGWPSPASSRWARVSWSSTNRRPNSTQRGPRRLPICSTSLPGPARPSCVPNTIRSSSGGWTDAWFSRRGMPSRWTCRARRLRGQRPRAGRRHRRWSAWQRLLGST